MEVCRSRKREGSACNYAYKKRVKSPSDDQDSEPYSAGSTNFSSPLDSGFPENGAISSLSGDDAPARRSESCAQEETALPSRVRILEEKVDWIGRELQLIREMLQFITKVMPAASSRQVVLPASDSRSKTVVRGSKRVSTNNKTEKPRRHSLHTKGFIDAQYSLHYDPTKTSNHLNIYPSTGSSDEKNSTLGESENRETNSDSVSKSCSDDYDSDTYADRENINGSGSGEGGTDSNQASREESPNNEFTADASNIKFHGHYVISGLDVIYLWEHGTDEMLPIRLWNESQLESGGEVIKKWQQVINIFKVACNGSLKTFVNKYTNRDGKLMSVSEILASNQEETMINNIGVPANHLSDGSSISSSSLNDLKMGAAHEAAASVPAIPSQLEQKPMPVYILPRKINGQKVSAKDVIRIWEEGFGNIPPVKIWTPNQKLKQQSKISRWKKIVDIFKTECNSNMALFQKRYTNDCGVLMPIATIISKYEQLQSSNDPMKQSIIANVTAPVINIKSDATGAIKTQVTDTLARNGTTSAYDYWRSYKRLDELGREWDFKEAQSCNERRAFTIRQVEDWQRNNIQSTEDESRSERIQSRFLSVPRCFTDQRKSTIARAVPPRHVTSISNLNQIGFQTVVVNSIGKMEPQVLIDEKNVPPINPMQKFKPVENGSVVEASSGSSPPCLTPVNQAVEKGRDPSPSSSESGENSDTYSGKDIDVTGSETSETSARSKSYSPVQTKSSKFVESKEHVYTTASNSLQQNTLTNVSTSMTKFDEQTPATGNRQPDEKYTVLPDSDDPFEVLNLWEHGTEKCPPIRFLTMNDDVIMHPRLVAWRKFIDIFRFHCNSDKQVLIEKYSDDKRRLLKVSEILQRFESTFTHRPYETTTCTMKSPGPPASTPVSTVYQNNHFPTQLDVKKPFVSHSDLYILPRKVNGHKVSARDVIHIWHHGFKNVPPVGSWLPHQKVRQQSKISRWKKIVEIFEVDCNGNMQLFERKYSNKTGDLLPIAAIISKFEAEKNALEFLDLLFNNPVVNGFGGEVASIFKVFAEVVESPLIWKQL
eukprot:gene12402-3061_t